MTRYLGGIYWVESGVFVLGESVSELQSAVRCLEDGEGGLLVLFL